MRMLMTCTAISLTLAGSAFAYDGCGAAGCGPAAAGCGPKDGCYGGCTATPKKVDIKKTCFNISLKKICIPPTRFPWDPSPCDSLCGDNGECGAKANCGPAAAATAGECGAGECGALRSKTGGLVSRLRDLLGMSNRGICRVIKVPEESSVKVGETCSCTWKCDDPSDPNAAKAGCGPCGAPKAGAPATEEAPGTEEAPAPKAPGAAPSETAARVFLRQLR